MVNGESTYTTNNNEPTLEMPKPPLIPRPRSNHHIPAPAIPAKPVPLDHAPSAVLEDTRVGRVVVSCKNVNSPSPDDNDARDIPNRRELRLDDAAMIYSPLSAD